METLIAYLLGHNFAVRDIHKHLRAGGLTVTLHPDPAVRARPSPGPRPQAVVSMQAGRENGQASKKHIIWQEGKPA
jgi:hypothetical protein